MAQPKSVVYHASDKARLTDQNLAMKHVDSWRILVGANAPIAIMDAAVRSLVPQSTPERPARWKACDE